MWLNSSNFTVSHVTELIDSSSQRPTYFSIRHDFASVVKKKKKASFFTFYHTKSAARLTSLIVYEENGC